MALLSLDVEIGDLSEIEGLVLTRRDQVKSNIFDFERNADYIHTPYA